MKHPNRPVRIAQFYSQCMNALWLVVYGHTCITEGHARLEFLATNYHT